MTLHETERRSVYISTVAVQFTTSATTPLIYFSPFLLQPSTFMGPLLSFIVSLNPLPSNLFYNLESWSRSVQYWIWPPSCFPNLFALALPYIALHLFLTFVVPVVFHLFPCPQPLLFSLYVSGRLPSGIPVYNTLIAASVRQTWRATITLSLRIDIER